MIRFVHLLRNAFLFFQPIVKRSLLNTMFQSCDNELNCETFILHFIFLFKSFDTFFVFIEFRQLTSLHRYFFYRTQAV